MSGNDSKARSRSAPKRGLSGLVATALLSSLLPGCPLSDNYFVKPTAGLGASAGAAGVVAGNTGGSSVNGPGAGGRGGGGDTTRTCIPELERCDGVNNDCDNEVDEGAVCPIGCSAKRHDDHFYLLCVSNDTVDALGADDASARCADLGVQFQLELSFGLAWIESSAENDFLKDWLETTAPPDGIVWMAANDDATEGKWVWGRRSGAEQFFTSTSAGGGTPYMDRFNDFAAGEPNGAALDDEDCGAFDSALGWRWIDESCTTPLLAFVCEEHPAA